MLFQTKEVIEKEYINNRLEKISLVFESEKTMKYYKAHLVSMGVAIGYMIGLLTAYLSFI